MKNKIIVILGPTASGKTQLSVEIALKFNGECINADSTQIFCGTDIATNKITEDEMKGVRHHLLSIKDENDKYSVFEFQCQAREIIEDILSRGKTPILVGGTGLYISAVIQNYNFIKEEISIKDENDNLSNEELWNKLLKIDPESSKVLHINNRGRVIRAIRIFEHSKKAKSELIKHNDTMYYKNVLLIGLNPNRDELYNRINNRVLELTKKGLFKEIEDVYKKTNYKHTQALKCIGGPEIILYLKKEINYNKCIELMQKNNRHYSKRQLTWFKNKIYNINWFKTNYENFDLTINEVISFCENNL